MGEEYSRSEGPYLKTTKATETNKQQINKTLLLYTDIHRKKKLTEVSHLSIHLIFFWVCICTYTCIYI